MHSTCLAVGLSGNNTLEFSLVFQSTPQGLLQMFSWSSSTSSVMFVISSVTFLFVNNTWLTMGISNDLGVWNIYFYSEYLSVLLFLFVSILYTSEMVIHRQKNLALEPIKMQLIVTGSSKRMLQTATETEVNLFPITSSFLASGSILIPLHWREWMFYHLLLQRTAKMAPLKCNSHPKGQKGWTHLCQGVTRFLSR